MNQRTGDRSACNSDKGVLLPRIISLPGHVDRITIFTRLPPKNRNRQNQNRKKRARKKNQEFLISKTGTGRHAARPTGPAPRDPVLTCTFSACPRSAPSGQPRRSGQPASRS